VTMHWHKMLCQSNSSEMLETKLPLPPPSLLSWVGPLGTLNSGTSLQCSISDPKYTA
jgi:hypothetical protein